MDDDTEIKNSNYRIIKCSNIYYVEKKYYNENNIPYWEKMTEYILGTFFGSEFPITFSSIKEAKDFINDDKLKNDFTEKIVSYL